MHRYVIRRLRPAVPVPAPPRWASSTWSASAGRRADGRVRPRGGDDDHSGPDGV